MNNSTQSSNPVHTSARLSLLSIELTAAVTTVHHLYKLGLGAFGLGTVLIGFPIAFLLWFRSTKRGLPLILYGLVNLWIIIGFGIVDGFWDSTIKVYFANYFFTSSRYFIRLPLGSYLFEVTGVLTFVASLFAAYYSYKFITTVITEKPEWSAWKIRLQWVVRLAAVALVFLGGYESYQRAMVVPFNGIIKIGVTIPMTGPQELLGKSFLKALEMAKENVRNTRYTYELVVENSGTTPVETERAIQKLFKESNVQAIVGGISASGKIVKPYATAEKIPHLCVCSIETIGDGEFNFTNIPLAEDEAIAWVKEAQRRGIKTVAILHQNYPSIENHVHHLSAEAEKVGINVVYEAEFEASTINFRPMIAAAKNAAPDVYYISGFVPGLDILGAQLKDAGIHNLTSIVAFSVSNKPELFEGCWYTDSYVDTTFKLQFERKYPGVRFATHMMPYAYDSFFIVVQAFESGEDPVEYIQRLTTYPGTAGTITRDPGSGNFRSAPAVWTIKNGKPELLAAK